MWKAGTRTAEQRQDICKNIQRIMDMMDERRATWEQQWQQFHMDRVKPDKNKESDGNIVTKYGHPPPQEIQNRGISLMRRWTPSRRSTRARMQQRTQYKRYLAIRTEPEVI